jgi:hypothetical protein
MQNIVDQINENPLNTHNVAVYTRELNDKQIRCSFLHFLNI